MPISTALDVVLESDDIVILGPPTSIDLAVDIGPQGERGSRYFTGSQNPNDLTLSQFEALFGYVPVYGDTFLRTGTGENYGKFYTYLPAPGGDQWQLTISMNSVLDVFFNVNDTFVLAGKNGGTGAANPGKSLLLGGNVSFNGTAATTFNITGNTVVTFPTNGTLATTGSLSQFSSTTSAQLAGVISDETGSGSLVFATSPALAGTPTSTTAAVDTDTTQIATTAFVLGQAASASPEALGSVSAGSSTRYARADHVHPTTGLATSTSPQITTSITTDSSTFNLINTTATTVNFAGDATTINIGSASCITTISNDLIVSGNLTVSGSATYINTNDLYVEDNKILLNSNVSTSPTLDAYIEIERGTSPNVSIRWNETSAQWEFTNDGSTYQGIGTGGGGGGTTNTEDVLGISFFTMGA